MIGECFLCGRWAQLDKHHIFGSALRNKSEKYNLFVYLCRACHTDSPDGVHHDAQKMQALHEYGERKWLQEHNATIEDFRREFYKNYLEE